MTDRISSSPTTTQTFGEPVGAAAPTEQPLGPVAQGPVAPPDAEVQSYDPLYMSGQALQQHAPSPPKQRVSTQPDAPPTVSVRALQTSRGSSSAQASLKDLTAALSKSNVFDADTFGKGLGTQLNVSFFDKGSHKTGFYKDLAAMLDRPKQTRAQIKRALSHLPQDMREEAVDAVMDKLTTKLCARIQDIMKRDVNQAAAQTKTRLAPYAGEDSTARAKLMHTLLEAKPALTKGQMVQQLQEVGVAKGDATTIAEGLVAASKDSAQRQAIAHVAAGGAPAGAQWEDGRFFDGAVRNLDQAMQSGFKDTLEHVDSVVKQMANDASKGDASFTNPLFERAKIKACKQLGISLKDGSGSSKAINEKIEDQKLSDETDAMVAGGIMCVAGLVVPGGIVAALVTGAMSSAPGVMIAQNNLDASRSGAAMGTNTQALAEANAKIRNNAVGSAAAGIGLGALGAGGKAVDASALGNAAQAIRTQHGAKALHGVAKEFVGPGAGLIADELARRRDSAAADKAVQEPDS